MMMFDIDDDEQEENDPSIANTINKEKGETKRREKKERKWEGGREAKTINDDTDIWCAPGQNVTEHILAK